jgi:phage shock protein PspC (stress-responsive transcriptional regulator)
MITMKKTITVNIGGTVFSIDEDAYELLRLYLDKIESHFTGSTDREEIMSDIESRIAELLSRGEYSLNHAITIKEVEEVIEIMGEPEDYADGTQEENAGRATRAKTKRRIYRDVDNRLLGGVCSGLAAYFAIDVVWIRLIFVVLTLMVFSGLLVYLLLWLVIPPAVTTAQKLEMKGEPVNINNIGRAVREEFEKVKKSFKI